MVDFKKKLLGKNVEAIIDPVKLYDTLDRAHDKGPLRPAQIAVLNEWFLSVRQKKDVIIKLHTGQGKTLIGLLILQSQLNQKHEPVVYLCPDNFLIEQTCDQAKQFGIATCRTDTDLPEEFNEGKKILVTSVQKLFNGLTKFGLNKKSRMVGTLLMDDAHACCDNIREACRIRIPKDDPAYDQLKTLFSSHLEQQGVGIYADICNDKHDALLPVPYWAWIDHESEVANILSTGSDRNSIKFAWPLLKNILGNCQCVISGSAVEIEPYIPPLDAFGTYWQAPHRIFMSATVTDDSFLVKGLQLLPDTIINPLTYNEERWSGEKMVLIPSLIHEDLDRQDIVHYFAKSSEVRNYGIVVLASSFNNTKDWEGYGAKIANKNNVGQVIEDLRMGKFENIVVLVNRYDGIDLPDDICRVLIFDRKPYLENLIDLYQEACRPNSKSTNMRIVRTVEQGLGRSVRGEKDYSVIVIIGPDITRLVRDKRSRTYLSNQMATQIEIGIEIADMARQDIGSTKSPMDVFSELIRQCLNRDPHWKAFYIEKMDSVKPSGVNRRLLESYATELSAEKKYQNGEYEKAVAELQMALDKDILDSVDKGWYLQEIARYTYRFQRPESQKMQISAYSNNRLLLRPPYGVTVAKLTIVSQGRIERIIDWVTRNNDYQQLQVALSDILGRLTFGSKADKFEQALDEVSRILGFQGERPDKHWKEGPDNLWALDAAQYILWECKSEVDESRTDINKRETEQMNRSCAWFEKHYKGSKVKNIIVHPSRHIASAAAFTHDVEVMAVPNLKHFVKKVAEFFKSFESLNFSDLSPSHVQKLVNTHKLSVESLLTEYTKPLNKYKR